MKRWLVRGGVALGVLVLLIVAFYVEENWRGARLWAATKAEYEAKGFNFDPKSLIPPPIPDEENFAQSDIWKHLLAADDPRNKSRPNSTILKISKPLADWLKQSKQITVWRLGQKQNVPPLTFFDTARDEISQLYTANGRQSCRFDMDYDHPFPASARRPSIDLCQVLSPILSIHAHSALERNEPAIAELDIAVCIKLASGCSADPALISGVRALHALRLTLLPLSYGIDHHLWSDAQLIALQKQLSQIDLLKTFRLSIQGELLFFYLINAEKLKNDRHSALSAVSQIGTLGESFYACQVSRALVIIGPSGWYDMTKAQGSRYYLDALLPMLDPANHQADWRLRKRVLQNEEAPFDSHLPTTFLLAFMASGTEQATRLFAESQSYLDMAQVACGLERYWLVNKKYPATLAELEPKFIAKVPHDLCNGEPLHYRVEADGNYALYSVGFNGTDDGGKVVMKKDSATSIDPKLGDWVWPRQRDAAPSNASP